MLKYYCLRYWIQESKRLILTAEPVVIQIKYVSPDGSVTDGPLYGSGATPKTSAQPQYKRPRNDNRYSLLTRRLVPKGVDPLEVDAGC
jgi:hypothetical protein